MVYKFHFALSFSKSSRNIARGLAEALRSLGYAVFFDEWFEHEMLGKSGTDYLRHVYTSDAQHCIVLIDSAYDERKWSRFEREIIEARALDGPTDVLIPVVVEDHRPAWLPDTRIYCDFKSRGIEGTTALLAKKLPLFHDTLPVSFAMPEGLDHQLVITRKSVGDQPRVLVVNAGGAIAYCTQDQSEARRSATWSEFQRAFPSIDELPFGVDIVTFTPPIVSSDMTPEHWRAIANAIAVHYRDYYGFVVLHGVDTLSYLASALSLYLRNLGKPVVIAYSQMAAFSSRTDAQCSFLSSLHIAGSQITGLPLIQEVCVLSYPYVLRGSRVRKRSSNSFCAFESPYFPPLGEVGECLQVQSELIRYQVASAEFDTDTRLAQRVLSLSLFPGFSEDFATQLLGNDESRTIQGLVLRTYGSGNISMDRTVTALLQRCQERRVPVVVDSMLKEESRLYQSDQALLAAGAIDALDMTNEMAFIKLAWAIGKNVPYSEIQDFMHTNICGELTPK